VIPFRRNRILVIIRILCLLCCYYFLSILLLPSLPLAVLGCYNYLSLPCSTIGLVYSIYDSTEEAIQKMIEASQRMIRINSQGELGGINPVIRKHFELQIKTLQNAPRDAYKLERLLKIKEREKDEAMHINDTQRLVTEIEMLVLGLQLYPTQA
jgi:hypothetical protein